MPDNLNNLLSGDWRSFRLDLLLIRNRHCQCIDGTLSAISISGRNYLRSSTTVSYLVLSVSLTYCQYFCLQQIAEMQKENFSLKLRIYFLEERMKKDGIPSEDVYNIVCSFI